MSETGSKPKSSARGFSSNLFRKAINRIIFGLVGILLILIKYYLTPANNKNITISTSIQRKQQQTNKFVKPVDTTTEIKKTPLKSPLKKPPKTSDIRTYNNQRVLSNGTNFSSNKRDSANPQISVAEKKDTAHGLPDKKLLTIVSPSQLYSTECEITSISKYSYNMVEQGPHGEILVYTYCESCNFKVRIDDEVAVFDVVKMPNKPPFPTFGYIPNEYEPGKHKIEIIDKKNGCHRVFPMFTVKSDEAIHICISER